MGDKVVAVLAVHNEEEMLSYTFQRIAGKVDAVVAVLDNCSDNSLSKVAGGNTFIMWLGRHRWRNYRAETKALGIQTAKQRYGDCLILMVDCDVLLDHGSIARAKYLLETTGKDAVVFAYRQYSLGGSAFDRFKDEVLNLFGKAVKKFTGQPVVSGLYLIRSGKAVMDDVASDYETVLPQLNTAWLQTEMKHLRPRYDRHTQKLMGVCRATLRSYSLRKVALYALCTLSPCVLAGFLTARLRGVKTVENGFY